MKMKHSVESFEERCEREVKQKILTFSLLKIKTQLDNLEYLQYIPLLCELIAMGTYLPHKYRGNNLIFTSKKLPKTLKKLTFEHNGKYYHIANLIHERLKEQQLDIPFHILLKSMGVINIQKKRENKYFKLDATM